MTLNDAVGILKAINEIIKGNQRVCFDEQDIEAIDTVVAELEKTTYTAEDMEAFFSWATDNGWSYGELTELWYNYEEEIEGFTIEDVIEKWEGSTK